MPLRRTRWGSFSDINSPLSHTSVCRASFRASNLYGMSLAPSGRNAVLGGPGKSSFIVPIPEGFFFFFFFCTKEVVWVFSRNGYFCLHPRFYPGSFSCTGVWNKSFSDLGKQRCRTTRFLFVVFSSGMPVFCDGLTKTKSWGKEPPQSLPMVMRKGARAQILLIFLSGRNWSPDSCSPGHTNHQWTQIVPRRWQQTCGSTCGTVRQALL